MADREVCRVHGLLEPSGEARQYETTTLAGAKRPMDETDKDDAPFEYEYPMQATQAQQVAEESDHEYGDDVVNDDNLHSDVAPSNRKRKATKNKQTDTKTTRTTKSTNKTKPPRKVIEKNETCMTNTGLEVEIAGIRKPAIYHNEYVKMFSHQLFGPQYTYGRESGEDNQYDKTSYLASQKDWAKAREHRPDILFEFEKPENKYLRTNPPPCERMIKGVRRVVIDTINNKPLRAFNFLPDAISTEAEGWLQEAWFRMDPGLEIQDLIQRMPYTAKDNPYEGRQTFNRSVRRRELFRKECRCLAWNRVNKNTLWDVRLKEEMRTNPDPTNPNSTRHLKDLTAEETLALKDATYMSGKHLKRGNNRALQGDRRRKKDQEIAEREAARAAQSSKRRFQADDDEDGDVVGPPQKKVREHQSAEANSVDNGITARPQHIFTSPPVGYQPETIQQKDRRMRYIALMNRLAREQSDARLAETYQTHGVSEYAPATTQAMRCPAAYGMDKAPPNFQPAFGPGSQKNDWWPPRQQHTNVAASQKEAENRRGFEHIQGFFDQDDDGSNAQAVTSQKQASISASGMSQAIPQLPRSSPAGGRMEYQPRSQSYPPDPYIPQHNGGHGFRSPVIPNIHQSYGGSNVQSMSSPILPSMSQVWSAGGLLPNSLTSDYYQEHRTISASNQQYLGPQRQYDLKGDVNDGEHHSLEFRVAGNAYSNYEATHYSNPAMPPSSMHQPAGFRASTRK